jgi:hypothetical protein
VDFEEGHLTAKTMGKGDVPLLQPRSYEEVQRILEAPDVVASEIAEACDGYKVETWIFDTATGTERRWMGSPKTEWSEGYGLLGESRNRVHELCPTIEDYKILNVEMVKFFRLVRQMPYHTVITAHAGLDRTPDSPRGLNVPDSRISLAGYPVLTGSLKYAATNLADLSMYMEQVRGTFTSYLVPTKKFNAKHRLGDNTPDKIENCTFQDLWQLYERSVNVAD